MCGGDLKMALRKQSKVGSSKKPTTISKVGFGERVQIYLYEHSGENLELLLGLWQVFNV